MPAIPCKICVEGSGRHPVYSSYEDRLDGLPEGYLCNTCADNAPASMVEITPDGQEIKPTGFSHIEELMRRGREREREMRRPRDFPMPQGNPYLNSSFEEFLEREREELRPRFPERRELSGRVAVPVFPFPQMPESPLNYVVLGVSVGRLLQTLGVDLLRVQQPSVSVDVSHAREEVAVFWQMNSGGCCKHIFTFEFLESLR